MEFKSIMDQRTPKISEKNAYSQNKMLKTAKNPSFWKMDSTRLLAQKAASVKIGICLHA